MTTPGPNRLLLGWYGDDFTGSTDVLEALALNGVNTVLAPNPERALEVARRFPEARAVGIAGLARGLTNDKMTGELGAAFTALQTLSPEIVHYKICSTFDSSPEVGSIGLAIEMGRRFFGVAHLPVVAAAPRLKRYVVFGNLFATVSGQTHRLDRHPTMSRHPVTPMDEADLRLHLARQTNLPSTSLDVLTLEGGVAQTRHRIEQWQQETPEGILIVDGLTQPHLATTGTLLWEKRSTLARFVVGSSGVEWALAPVWHQTGLVEIPASPPQASPVGQLLVISGSASPVTEAQIARAEANGYRVLTMLLPALLDPARAEPSMTQLATQCMEILASGRSLVVCSARGPHDPAIASARALPLKNETIEAAVGRLLGTLLQQLLERYPVPRVCVCGGDTSGRITRMAGVEALTLAAPLAPGAPLCQAYQAAGRPALQIILKGGQNGSPDFFESARLARSEIPQPESESNENEHRIDGRWRQNGLPDHR